MQAERIMVHAVSPICRRQFNLGVARALDLQEDGHDVSMTYCDATAGTCTANLNGNPLTCLVCRNNARRSIEQVGLRAVAVHDEAAGCAPANAEQPIGGTARRTLATAVNSNLITQLRLLPKELNRVLPTRLVKKRYFRTALGLYAAYRHLINKFQPDRVEVVNGRHACSKFPILAATEAGVEFTTLEYNATKHPLIFTGSTPHDRTAFQNRIKSVPLDEEMAEAYFAKRRSAAYNRFAKQHLTFQPDPRAAGRELKVSFFLSSQDECAALGKQWQSPFPHDADVVEQTCRRFPNYFFSVRFHPHQASMTSDVVSPYKQLEHLNNLRIYYPDSVINSYELIDWSDRIVTFASTVAVESCWMGKSAIQLGPSFYDQLNISYTPDTMDEFFELLARPELPPCDRSNAARLAYFNLRDRDEIRHLDLEQGRNRVRGMKPKLWLSTRISKRLNNVTRKLLKASFRMAG